MISSVGDDDCGTASDDRISAVTLRAIVVVTVQGADSTLQQGLQAGPDHSVILAEDLRHALLLQRVFQPDLLLLPRLPTDDELGLLSTMATRPVVVVADVTPRAAVLLVSQGIARIVPPSSLPLLQTVMNSVLVRELPVVRALAQLSVQNASGTLSIGLPGQAQGEIVVDKGQLRAAAFGGRHGSEALSALAGLEAPVLMQFSQPASAVHNNGADVGSFDAELGTAELELCDVDVDGDGDTDAMTTGSLRGLRTPVSVGHDFLRGLPPPRCLIVEDNADLARLYQHSLRSKGFNIAVACDGAEGFELAKAGTPDVILSDIMMPQVSGWHLLGLIRNNARLRETPFLLLSHEHNLVRQLKMANGGADAYLEKSLRHDVIAAAVIAAVAPLRHIEQQLQDGATSVDGMLAGIGPQTLLRLCHRQKLSGWLTLRPTGQHFLISLHQGDIVDAECSMGTATLQHRDALRALLLVDDGPFHFRAGALPTSTPARPLLPLIDELCDELERLLENLRTGALLSGQVLRVRPELLAIYRGTSAPAAAPILDLLAAGGAPRDLIATGTIDPLLVDSVVRDLFRKGVIAP